MLTIIMNTFKEKIRSKALNITSITGFILMLLISTGNGLTINGQEVLLFEDRVPVAMSVMQFLGSLLAIMISLQTIPTEFERKTTHLILTRGVKRWQYMFSLTAGNIFTSVVSESQERFFITGFTMDKKGISNNRYIAILFHEGLHAYQLDCFKDNLFNSLSGILDDNEEILRLVDTETTIKNLYRQENKALYDILQHQDKGELKDKISRYLTIREQRMQSIQQKYGDRKLNLLKLLENYYEKVEGTARYTEAQVARLLGDNDLYQEYIYSIQVNMDGNEKYYRSGMAMCLIFDELHSAWKEEVFSRPDSMVELLAEYGRALDEQ